MFVPPFRVGLGRQHWISTRSFRDDGADGNRAAPPTTGFAAFTCRKYPGFSYASQRCSYDERLRDRTQEIRIRLVAVNLFEPFPPMPAGMHWRTYWQLRDQSERLSLRSLVAAVRRFD
jgi:hypothetical protein